MKAQNIINGVGNYRRTKPVPSPFVSSSFEANVDMVGHTKVEGLHAHLLVVFPCQQTGYECVVRVAFLS